MKITVTFPLLNLFNWCLEDLMLFLRLLIKYGALELSFSLSFIFWNIGEHGAKNLLQTIEQLIQFSYLLLWRKISWSILLNKALWRGIPQRLLDKFNHLCIYISLKQTLSSGETTRHNGVRTNSLCRNILLLTSFCFLQVNQQKRITMISTSNVLRTRTYLQIYKSS